MVSGRRLILSFLVISGTAQSDVISELKEITSQDRVKVVWSKAEGNNFGFPGSSYLSNQTLQGFDTESGVVHTISSDVGNYQRPLITHDGEHVVYTDLNDGMIYKIPWSGEGAPTSIAEGFAGCLWLDQDGQTEYAVYAEECGLRGEEEIHMVNLANPSEKVFLYNEYGDRMVNPHWLCISKNGSIVGGVWGHPTCAAFRIETGNSIASTNGCWTSIPWDTTIRFLLLNEDHTALLVLSSEQGSGEIPTGTLNHFKIATYHKSIACVVRGMNPEGGQEGGYVQIMKISDDFTTISDTVNVTTESGHGFPDLWSGPSTRTRSITSQKSRVGPVVVSCQTQRHYTVNGKLSASQHVHRLPTGAYVTVSGDGEFKNRSMKRWVVVK